MSIIYNECLGNTKLVYSAFAEENKETNSNIYGISVKDNNKNRLLLDWKIVKNLVFF